MSYEEDRDYIEKEKRKVYEFKNWIPALVVFGIGFVITMIVFLIMISNI